MGVAIAHRCPRDVRDGRWSDSRGPDDWAKMAPSRGHGHLIDGSLLVNSFRVGGMEPAALPAA